MRSPGPYSGRSRPRIGGRPPCGSLRRRGRIRKPRLPALPLHRLPRYRDPSAEGTAMEETPLRTHLAPLRRVEVKAIALSCLKAVVLTLEDEHLPPPRVLVDPGLEVDLPSLPVSDWGEIPKISHEFSRQRTATRTRDLAVQAGTNLAVRDVASHSRAHPPGNVLVETAGIGIPTSRDGALAAVLPRDFKLQLGTDDLCREHAVAVAIGANAALLCRRGRGRHRLLRLSRCRRRCRRLCLRRHDHHRRAMIRVRGVLEDDHHGDDEPHDGERRLGDGVEPPPHGRRTDDRELRIDGSRRLPRGIIGKSAHLGPLWLDGLVVEGAIRSSPFWEGV